jgi:hypothetical protein
VGLARSVVGLAFLLAADLCLAAAPVLAHGDVTMVSPARRASQPGRDPPAPAGALLAARDQGTHARSHSSNRHPGADRHPVYRGRSRRPAPPRFHAGPNGVFASLPFTRPGSPGRELGEPGRRGGFIAWYGPVFWPYASEDLFEYLLWPSDDADYDGPFWVNAYAAVVDPALRAATASARPRAPEGPFRSAGRSRAGARGLAGQSREFAEICGGRTPTGWPAERLSRTLNPTAGQDVPLRAFKAATAAAAKVLDNACTNEMPTSSVHRLDAMERRLDAMRQAMTIIRPALDRLYGALSDAQKARLEAVEAPDLVAVANDAIDPASTALICGPSPPPLSPPEPQPNPLQVPALQALNEALSRAVERLRAACPTPTPQTLPERLTALETRLSAMLAAVRIERPALAAFSDALSREPKSHADEVTPTLRR